MDIIGPLPRSRSGKKYVLVICDYATRYPEAIPLHSTDASHIAEALMGVFSRVGIPSEILTDQGSNFASQLLTKLYRMLHVHPISSSPYHPQTDGLVERFNQTLKSMLRKVAIKEGRDWDKMILFCSLLTGKSLNHQLDSPLLNYFMAGQSEDHWIHCENLGKLIQKVRRV